MKNDKHLLPEHFPKEKQFTEEQLKPLNDAIDSLPGRLAGGIIGFFVLVVILSIFFSQAIGGTVGNAIAAIVWILFPAGAGLAFSLASKPVKEASAKLGITLEEYKAAVNNRNNNTAAESGVPGSLTEQKPVSMGYDATVYYRYTCKNCKKDSGWKTFFLTASSQRDLDIKKADFRKLTEKKKKCFENKQGYLTYSLDRTCPHCGKVHAAKKPSIVPVILLAIPVALFLCSLFFLISEKAKGAFVSGFLPIILFLIIFLVPFIILLIRYIIFSRSLTVPEYRFERPDDFQE